MSSEPKTRVPQQRREHPETAAEDAGSTPSAKNAGRWDLYRFLLLVGLAANVAGVLALTGFQLAILASEAAAFFLVLLVPAILSSVLLLARPAARPWMYLAAGICVALLPMLVLGLFGVFALANPLSGIEFAGSSLFLLAILFALPAGVRGFQKLRAGLPAPPLRDSWRTRHGLGVLVVTSILIGAMLSSALAYSRAVDTGYGGGSDLTVTARVDVVTENFLFHPAALNLTAGKVTEIVVVNRDPSTHTFTYALDGTTHNHEILPGATVKFLVMFPTAGSVRYWCIPHEQMGMVGTISVG